MNTELFNSGGKGKRYGHLMGKARQVNAERDSIDRQGGTAPEDGPLDLHLRTAITALVSGVEMADWSCVAEGLDMLQHAEVRARLLPGSSMDGR